MHELRHVIQIIDGESQDEGPAYDAAAEYLKQAGY